MWKLKILDGGLDRHPDFLVGPLIPYAREVLATRRSFGEPEATATFPGRRDVCIYVHDAPLHRAGGWAWLEWAEGRQPSPVPAIVTLTLDDNLFLVGLCPDPLDLGQRSAAIADAISRARELTGSMEVDFRVLS